MNNIDEAMEEKLLQEAVFKKAQEAMERNSMKKCSKTER